MLLQFTVGNYLSFKEPVTVSMVASSINEHEEINVFNNGKIKLLKSAVIYGANASGKSNLIKAMKFFIKFIISSSKDKQVNEKIEVTRFKLSNEMDDKPSTFEIVFIQNGKRFRYGFQVDEDIVHKEWLYYVPKAREVKLFIRDQQSFNLGPQFREGEELETKTRPNALFLSVVAQFNGEIAGEIFAWLNNVNVVSGLSDDYLEATLIKLKKDESFKQSVLELLKIADLGIENFTVREEVVPYQSSMPHFLKEAKEIIRLEIISEHKKYDSENNLIGMEQFNFGLEESEGTKRFFAFSGPIIDTLENGKILIVDEFDSRLHPLLSQYLIKLFNSQQNSRNAQLLFVSHDVSSLNNKFFRRDQIWFAEKNRYEVTELFSLVEYKVRKDASFSKDYLLGKYGAIPYLQTIFSAFGVKDE